MPYKAGDVVTVKFTGRVNTNGGFEGGNSRVTEDETGIAHYLYLNGTKTREETLGDKDAKVTPGSAISVSFRAEIVEGNRGPNSLAPDKRLTRVLIKRTPDQPYYGTYRTYYFIDLDSPSVQAEGAPITAEDTTITSAALEARIAALSAGRECQVVRNRNGAVLFTGKDEGPCRKFIEDEDYDPERVTIRLASLGAEADLELSRLTALQADASARLKSADWTLFASQYFSTDVIERAICQRLGLPADSDFEKWPLSVIDISEAGDVLLNEDYAYVRFGTRSFYGKAAPAAEAAPATGLSLEQQALLSKLTGEKAS